MSRPFRDLITWLMLLALPLQGLAASGGWPCHATTSRVAAVASVPPIGQGHADPEPHGHHHEGHLAHHHADAVAEAGAHASPFHASAGCAVCANCGHAIGLLPAWPALGAAPPPAPPLAWVLPSWPRPDWPVADKPPRA